MRISGTPNTMLFTTANPRAETAESSVTNSIAGAAKLDTHTYNVVVRSFISKNNRHARAPWLYGSRLEHELLRYCGAMSLRTHQTPTRYAPAPSNAMVCTNCARLELLWLGQTWHKHSDMIARAMRDRTQELSAQTLEHVLRNGTLMSQGGELSR